MPTMMSTANNVSMPIKRSNRAGSPGFRYSRSARTAASPLLGVFDAPINPFSCALVLRWVKTRPRRCAYCIYDCRHLSIPGDRLDHRSLDRTGCTRDQQRSLETVTCRACSGVHLVNVATGRVLVAHHQEFASPNRHSKN